MASLEDVLPTLPVTTPTRGLYLRRISFASSCKIGIIIFFRSVFIPRKFLYLNSSPVGWDFVIIYKILRHLGKRRSQCFRRVRNALRIHGVKKNNESGIECREIPKKRVQIPVIIISSA